MLQPLRRNGVGESVPIMRRTGAAVGIGVVVVQRLNSSPIHGCSGHPVPLQRGRESSAVQPRPNLTTPNKMIFTAPAKSSLCVTYSFVERVGGGDDGGDGAGRAFTVDKMIIDTKALLFFSSFFSASLPRPSLGAKWALFPVRKSLSMAAVVGTFEPATSMSKGGGRKIREPSATR